MLFLHLLIAFLALMTVDALPTEHGARPRSSDSQQRSGIATFFYQNGIAGACGTVHDDWDHVIALQTALYQNGAHCGQTVVITNKNTGHTTTGVVADECPTCDSSTSIDLSKGLFEEFASDQDGIFPVSWYFE
ncbi:hypothetical protein M422DRAFT_778280 [Sphaerobolus stellatus SS14]|uniref:RlpA-like protein double-psi beta-barrel domain-containing protein n=1 Tax=Sphaerobolus stellatus (strain SS14) TaxID=990650 RepID=A0A0C9UVT3_SPHS4|nr:hypothetical protein M422DRAFT_778280 [Sphaerobolus stellatus SS14]